MKNFKRESKREFKKKHSKKNISAKRNGARLRNAMWASGLQSTDEEY